MISKDEDVTSSLLNLMNEFSEQPILNNAKRISAYLKK